MCIEIAAFSRQLFIVEVYNEVVDFDYNTYIY